MNKKIYIIALISIVSLISLTIYLKGKETSIQGRLNINQDSTPKVNLLFDKHATFTAANFMLSVKPCFTSSKSEDSTKTNVKIITTGTDEANKSFSFTKEMNDLSLSNLYPCGQGAGGLAVYLPELQGGNYNAQFIIDPSNTSNEDRNENDNTYNFAFKFNVDMSFYEAATFTPLNFMLSVHPCLTSDQSISKKSNVKIITTGTDEANKSFSFTKEMNDLSLSNLYPCGQNAGGIVVYLPALTEGNYNAQFIIDPDNTIFEPNEVNNIYNFPFTYASATSTGNSSL